MIVTRSEREIEKMREAGRITAEVLDLVEENIKTSVTTSMLNQLAEDYIRSQGAVPSFLKYVPPGFRNVKPYPATLCVSINDEVVHGIPSRKRFLREGDIVSIDCGVFKNGYHGDAAKTFAVGKASSEKQKLMDVTKKCLESAIEQAVVGKRLFDISFSVQNYAESFGYGVIENMVGHGIGTRLHEEPAVPNIGKPNTGMFLREGMVLAIEPMINMGKSRKAKIGSDTWTARTEDGKPCAHFEHTVVVRKDKAEILTVSRK